MSNLLKVKPNKFVLAAAAILCAVFSVVFFNSPNVKVKAEDVSVTASPTTSFDNNHEYTAAEVTLLKNHYLDEIGKLEHYAVIKGIESTETGKYSDEIDGFLSGGDKTPKGVAEAYFSGTNGLAGVLGIYEIANDFYDFYLAEDATIKNQGNPLYAFSIAEMQGKALFVNRFSLKNYYDGNTGGYDVENARRNSETFYADYFQKAEEIRDYLDDRYAKVYLSEINFDTQIYFSEKYGEEYTAEKVYGAADADWQSELTAVRNELVAKGRAVKDYVGYERKVSDAMLAVKTAYDEKFAGLQTAAARAEEKAKKFDETVSFSKLQDKLDYLKAEIDEIKTAVDAFSALPTVTINIWTYDVKNEKGEAKSATIDLKTGLAAADDGKSGDDYAKIVSLIRITKNVTEEGVKAVYLHHVGLYGQSGESVVVKNKNLAQSLIDSITETGVIPNPYSYGEKTVSEPKGIIDAFYDSYSTPSALQYDGENSEAVNEKYLLPSVSSDKNKKKNKQGYTITITYFVKNEDTGEFEATPQFDAEAFIEVREGATPSVERNTLKALRNPDKYAKKLSAEQRKAIKGKGLWKYITLTVYEPNSSGEAAVKTNLKNVDGTNSYYVVSIAFDEEGITAKQADAFTIVEYGHAEITDVISNIEREGKTMKFQVNDVSKLLAWEWLTGDKKWDWAMWIALGVVCLLVLALVILIVAICIKKKKYKVIFYARGGKYNKTVKARYGCKFNYPKDPVKKGYVFMGWYADKKCTTRFASTEINKKGTVNVYAKWMKLEEYEQLNEQYSKAKAVVDPAVASADAQYFSSLQKDPEIEKIEAEKLSYMAKKAEEDRKTEEVKLQSIKEIEASKNSDEARAKAEKEADEARNALDSALKERDAIIAKARAEERSKCYGEVADSLKNDNENLANALSGAAIVPVGAAANAQQPMNLEEQLRKIKEEAKAEARKEIEEEMKRKAEEEARINALVEARVKEIIDRKDKEAELAKVGSETKAATDPAILERLALAEEKIARYEEMLAQKSVAEDNAAALEELPAEIAPALEEAEVEEKEEVKETAPAIDPELLARLAEAEARIAAYEADEKNRAEAEAKAKEEAEALNAAKAKEEAEAKAAAEADKETAKLFDRLKAETASYVRGDDLTVGLVKEDEVLKITEANGKVELELNVPFEDLEEKGYNVLRGNKFPAMYELESDGDVDEALELIEEAMSAHGMMKSVPQVVYASTKEDRLAGYTFVIDNEKVAETTEEFYSVLRAYAGSFADVEGYEGEDKPLVKMFKDGSDVLVYLNSSAAGLKAAEPFMVEQGYASLVVVKNAKDCQFAENCIEAMMKDNGLIRYPLMTGFVEGGDDDGFAYILKA